MKSFLSLIGACTLLLASCGPINFSSQDVYCRYNTDDDSLTVKLVYQQVRHVDQTTGWFYEKPPEKIPDLERGEKVVRNMLSGRREFMIGNNVLTYDLDDTDPEKQSEFVKGISVESVTIDTDEAGRLRIEQVLKFRDMPTGMKIANFEFRREVKESIDKGKLTVADSPFDQATIDPIKQDVEQGRDWLAWDQSGLQIRIPASPQLLAKFLHLSLEGAGSRPDDQALDLVSEMRAFHQMIKPLSAITVKDDHVVMTFGPDENGWLHFNFLENWDHQSAEDSGKYDAQLYEHLIEQGLEFPANWKPDK